MKEISLTIEQSNFIVLCMDEFVKNNGLKVAGPALELLNIFKDTFAEEIQKDQAAEEK